MSRTGWLMPTHFVAPRSSVTRTQRPAPHHCQHAAIHATSQTERAHILTVSCDRFVRRRAAFWANIARARQLARIRCRSSRRSARSACILRRGVLQQLELPLGQVGAVGDLGISCRG